MLTKYLQAAKARAKYEIFPDGSYYGEIPGFQGVWAAAESLEACRTELQEVLKPIRRALLDLRGSIPAKGGYDLSAVRKPAIQEHIRNAR